MKIKHFAFLLGAIAFMACGSDTEPTEIPDDQPNQQSDDDVQVTDDTSPLIVVEGLGSIVEVNTDIQISVTDESSVDTKLLINNNEVYSTSNTAFSFQLNPYMIPVGNTALKLVSVDEFGNKTEEDFEVEIKHFLMEFHLGTDEANRYSSIWTFFNDSEGNLITTQKMEVGSTRIYTDELVDGDYLLYTIVKYQILGIEGQNRSLRNTTYKVDFAEIRNEISFSSDYSLDNYVEIEIDLLEDTGGYTKYSAKGSQYDTFTSGGGTLLEIVGISYDNPEHIYLRTDLSGGAPELFDGKKENYSYYRFAPETTTPTINIAETDLKSADESIQLTIPNHTPGSFVFDRVGFLDQEDMVSNINHHIFQVHEPNDQYRDYIDLPILEGLGLYNNTVNYVSDEKSFFGNIFGNNLDIAMPDWNLTFGVENGDVFVQENNDLDYYVVRFRDDDTSDINKRRYWIWDYRTFGSEETDLKRVPILDMPVEVISEINDSHYSNIDNLQPTSASALDFEQFNSFSETIDWLGLNKVPLTIDQQSYKQVSFFNSSTSGKTEQTEISKKTEQLKDVTVQF